MSLSRRVLRLERLAGSITNPEKPRECLVIAHPRRDASPEDIAKYEAERDAALARGAMVIELVGVVPNHIDGHGD